MPTPLYLVSCTVPRCVQSACVDAIAHDILCKPTQVLILCAGRCERQPHCGRRCALRDAHPAALRAAQLLCEWLQPRSLRKPACSCCPTCRRHRLFASRRLCQPRAFSDLNYLVRQGTYYRTIQQYMIDMENMFDLLATNPQLEVRTRSGVTAQLIRQWPEPRYHSRLLPPRLMFA